MKTNEVGSITAQIEESIAEGVARLRDPEHRRHVRKDIAREFQRLEHRLLTAVSRLIQTFHETEHHVFLSDAFNAYRDRCLREAGFRFAARENCLRKFWADTTLTPQHRRLLSVLADLYDGDKKAFGEISQRQLIRQAKVSESGARQLLTYLEGRGYIDHRLDAGRNLWKIRDEGTP